MSNTPGLLGTKPSRHFKIFREAEPAIFRFNGKLFLEHFNIDTNQHEWVETDEDYALMWIGRDAPSLKTTAEAVTTPTPIQVSDENSEELVESIRVRTRRRYWERRWDQGWFGHAYGGTKEEWVNQKLDEEGYL